MDVPISSDDDRPLCAPAQMVIGFGDPLPPPRPRVVANAATLKKKLKVKKIFLDFYQFLAIK